MSPSNPPTANATMMLRLDGSMSVGHSARRKLGGPEMYRVPMRAFSAGEENGKRRVKDLWRREGVDDVVNAL